MSKFSTVFDLVWDELKGFVGKTTDELVDIGIDVGEDVKGIYKEFEDHMADIVVFKNYPTKAAHMAKARSLELANRISELANERARLTIDKVIGDGFKMAAKILGFFAP